MKFLKLLLLISLFSCLFSPINNIEKFSGLSLKKNFISIKDTSQWIDFNGNGFRLIVLKPENQGAFQSVIDEAKRLNYKNFDARKFTNPEIAPYVKNGKGYYKFSWQEDEIQSIVIDTINSKIIYYLSIQ